MVPFHSLMKRLAAASLMVLAVLAVASCKEKKRDYIIVSHKPIVVKSNKPKSMGDMTQSREINWLGQTYKLTMSLRSDTSLPLASDGEQKYYDNRITLRILRSDGSVFFDRTFTKADFKSYVNRQYYNDGALLGIVFDKVEGNNICFAASVGSPDKSSDEFVPLVLKVSNTGGVSVSQSAMTDE
jgi:hypothetical protein